MAPATTRECTSNEVVVLTCHYTHTYPLVTGSPVVLSPTNTVLRRGGGDR